MNIYLSAGDICDLNEELSELGLETAEVESKGIHELQTLAIALGGGAGVAAIVRALGSAIESYYAGRSALESASVIEITDGEYTIHITGTNHGTALRGFQKHLEKKHSI